MTTLKAAVRPINRRRLLTALIAATFLPLAAAVYAQQQFRDNDRPLIWVGGGGWRRSMPKWATRDTFDGSWTFCRGYFQSDRREEGGSGWDTDFPGADNNFSVRLAELTNVHIKLDSRGQPDYGVVRLDDPLLFRCPMLHLEDAGTARFLDSEVEGLRAYLKKGGFVTVDDFWGTLAWEQWVEQIGRVLPPGEYPIVDLPIEHPILHTLYDVKYVEQVSSINFWSRSGGRVSEREFPYNDSQRVNFRGILDDNGRVMVLMAHNTDIPDTWEREGENKEYFEKFSPNGYAIGVDVALYALTH